KNNVRFSNTRRDMVESMTATAERIVQYELIYGKDEVEKFIDAVLAIQEHIDPSIIRTDLEEEEEQTIERIEKKKTPYDDLWEMDYKKKSEPSFENKRKKIPPAPETDLLFFLLHHSTELEEWQRDILTMIREEMLYF